MTGTISRRRCDCCEEEWEPEFFCERCSSEGELVTVDAPIVMWDYCGPDTEEREEWVTREICLNRCWCGVSSASRGRV